MIETNKITFSHQLLLSIFGGLLKRGASGTSTHFNVVINILSGSGRSLGFRNYTGGLSSGVNVFHNTLRVQHGFSWRMGAVRAAREKNGWVKVAKLL